MTFLFVLKAHELAKYIHITINTDRFGDLMICEFNVFDAIFKNV